MALITGTALVAIVWQGAVRIVGSKLAKELVKAGAKHLTKKNFKKTYDFFKGNKKLNTSEKNKLLEDLNIVAPKVKKSKVSKNLTPGIKPGESLQAYYTRMAKESRIRADKVSKKPEAPKKEVKKPEVPKKKVKKPEIKKETKETKVDTKAADEGAKIVEGVTKPGLLKQTKDAFSKSKIRKVVLPNPIKHPVWGTIAYGSYGYAGYQKNKSLMSESAKDALEIVKQKNLEDEKKLKKKTHETKIKETTLGEIDLNTLASPDGHIWKTDQSGNFVLP